MNKFILLLVLVFSFKAQALVGEFTLFMKGVSSKSSEFPRDIYVYLPPGYDVASDKRYPVLYMHDGQNLFDPERSTFGNTWKMDETLNDLIEAKLIPPIIVVGIDNTPDRTSEYTHSSLNPRARGGKADLYLDFIASELKLVIDQYFPTKPEVKYTALMGSSLGGLVSLYAGAKFNDIFGLIGAMSPSIWWDKKSILEIIKLSKFPLKVYMDSGMVGGEEPYAALEAAKLYMKMGPQKFQFILDRDGGHNEKSWARRLPAALIFLFGENNI